MVPVVEHKSVVGFSFMLSYELFRLTFNTIMTFTCWSTWFTCSRNVCSSRNRRSLCIDILRETALSSKACFWNNFILTWARSFIIVWNMVRISGIKWLLFNWTKSFFISSHEITSSCSWNISCRISSYRYLTFSWSLSISCLYWWFVFIERNMEVFLRFGHLIILNSANSAFKVTRITIILNSNCICRLVFIKRRCLFWFNLTRRSFYIENQIFCHGFLSFCHLIFRWPPLVHLLYSWLGPWWLIRINISKSFSTLRLYISWLLPAKVRWLVQNILHFRFLRNIWNWFLFFVRVGFICLNQYYFATCHFILFIFKINNA